MVRKADGVVAAANWPLTPPPALTTGIHLHGAAAHIGAASHLHRVATGGAQIDTQRTARRQGQVATDGDGTDAIAGATAVAGAIARRQHAAAGYRHAATGTADGAGAGQSGAAADGPLATDGAGDIEAPAGDLAGAAEAAAVATKVQAARAGLHDAATATDAATQCRGAPRVDDQAAVVGDVAGDRTTGAAIANLHGATGIDGGATGIGVVAGEGDGAAAGLGQAAAAADGAADGGVAADVEYQAAIVDDVAGDRAASASVANLQRAARVDRGPAGIAVVAGQGHRAAAGLGQAAAAADGTADCGVSTHVEHQAAVVGDAAADRSGGAAIAHLQRATGVDGGRDGIGVVAGQGQRAAARLGQATAAADSAAQQGVACNVGDQCAIVGDITGDRTAGTAVADLQRTARIDGGAAAVGVVADQGQHATAGLVSRCWRSSR
ncbi:hypothetical protein G6F57_014968 [Rhizopus arrhizus]|nr:hypothetical protein G6F57_014968 [Rhizopus arrhizus]